MTRLALSRTVQPHVLLPATRTANTVTNAMAITFETPKSPSSQLKTVLRYFEFIRALDLVELDTLFADGFVQSTRPLSLGVPSRTKEEDLAFLGALAEKLKGRRVEVINPRRGALSYHDWERMG